MFFSCVCFLLRPRRRRKVTFILRVLFFNIWKTRAEDFWIMGYLYLNIKHCIAADGNQFFRFTKAN